MSVDEFNETHLATYTLKHNIRFYEFYNTW